MSRPAFLLLAAAACEPPAGHPADTADTADSGLADPVEAECPAPTSGPTEHQDGGTDQVWTADAGPHVIPYDLSVHAAIRIEPCAVVRIAGGVTVSVFADGSLEADGTEQEPVLVERADRDEAWVSLRSLGGALSLVHTRIEGGGAPQSGAADVEAMIEPDARIHVEHVVLAGSASQGLALGAGGAFTPDSTDLVIEGSAGFPLRIGPTALGTVPDGAYTGNGTDEILVPSNAVTDVITEDVTIHDRGVPYRIGDALGAGELRVGLGQGGPAAVLTIEPGVELRFVEGGLLSIEHYVGPEPATGALVAVGTADRPIVFTSASASPAAGDWYGIRLGGGTIDGRTEISFARVAYAGRASSSGSSSCPTTPEDSINDAAIRILGDPGVRQFVRDTAIEHSASHGIDRGWTTTYPLDFVPTNAFDHVPACLQTWPANPTAPCPVPPPCPTE